MTKNNIHLISHFSPRRPGCFCLLIVSLLVLSGCRTVPNFPDRALCVKPAEQGRWVYWDTDDDNISDYCQYQDTSGRKTKLAFRTQTVSTNSKDLTFHKLDAPGPADQWTQLVNLDDAVPDVPHFIIILDGAPWHLVDMLYREGHFRLFYPPKKVISCFPSMTDLAFSRVFGTRQPIAYQARYFDRETNRIEGGDTAYMDGNNAGWWQKLQYRATPRAVALAYIQPKMMWDHELRQMADLFSKADTGTTIVYSMASAGLGTQGGREAMLDYLRTVDLLCEKNVHERQGKVKISIFADHGHGMAGRRRVTFDDVLINNGYNPSDRLDNPNDVVAVEFGLVNYAAFFTNEPAGTARAILSDPVTSLACYPDGDSVIVRTIEYQARIQKSGNGYIYIMDDGDPLNLADTIERLRQAGKVTPEGIIDDQAFFQATINHEYPDALRRIYFAFNGLVQKPADLIVCLREGYSHGKLFFDLALGRAVSAHGSLNQLNSATFMLTMWADGPPALRLEDVLPCLDKLAEK